MATATGRRVANPQSAQPAVDWATQVQSKGRNKPTRFILHGVEGVGKTSIGAMFPKPIVIMARGETGLETLLDSGQLKEVPYFPETQTWSDLMGQLRFLSIGDHDYKTVVIDTMNGCERLCHEFVCERDYRGDWGKQGFTSYMQGYEVALGDWRQFLSELDALRERGMGIVCLCHTKVEAFKNPEGADYDRYQPDMHRKTWSLTHKWADAVLFVNFFTAVDESGNRPKGKGGQSRVMYTVRHAAYDAKNRLGLPEEIDMGTSPQEAWKNFSTAVKEAKGVTRG